MERIDAELLIPVAGEPVRNAVVVLDGSLIGFAGPAAEAPPPGPGDTTVRVPVAMPGMGDCHGHFLGMTSVDEVAWVTTPVAVRAARSVRDLRAALNAGVWRAGRRVKHTATPLSASN